MRGLSAAHQLPRLRAPAPDALASALAGDLQPSPALVLADHCIDCLACLDDLDDDRGSSPCSESHTWLARASLRTYEPVAGVVELRLGAGDGVLIHGDLWHRPSPTLKAKRRMLILTYIPSWLRASLHSGPQPEDGLSRGFLEEADLKPLATATGRENKPCAELEQRLRRGPRGGLAHSLPLPDRSGSKSVRSGSAMILRRPPQAAHSRSEENTRVSRLAHRSQWTQDVAITAPASPTARQPA